MQFVRPAIAVDPRQFGRAVAPSIEPAAPQATGSDDLRLFLTTFAAGFLFVSVFIA